MSLNILIVDDSATVRGMISRTLSHAQIPLGTVLQAENGLRALEVLKEQWVDLVITDIHMPEMDGVALIDSIRGDSVLSQIPVVVVSTEGSETRMNEVKEKGAIAYLRKPFTPEQIHEIVHGALGVNHD